MEESVSAATQGEQPGMSTSIQFTVPGTPVGKGRAIFSRLQNGGVTARTPAKTRTWEGILRSAALDAMDNGEPLLGCLLLRLVFFMPVPPSWPQWKQEMALNGNIRPSCKPDLDNLEKSVKDALNSVCWRDDSQVVEVNKAEWYGARPHTFIEIQMLDALPAQTKRKP